MLQSSSFTWNKFAPFYVDNFFLSKIGDMSSLWNLEWLVLLCMHFHHVFWKCVEPETFHDKLHYWSLKLLLGLELTDKTSTFTSILVFTFLQYHLQDLIFFINSSVVGSHSSCQKTQAIRHSPCSRKIELISNQIKLHYIVY